MADKESEDWYKDVREKQIKRGSASKDDKDLLAIADKLLGGNSQMLVKYNSFPEYEVLKDGKTYRINPETNTAEEIKSNDKLDHEVVNDFSIDAIKDNFTPPGAKSKHEKVMENAEEVGIVDEMPEGWKEKEGVLTTPNGYKAISNGGSRFPKEGQKKHELKFIKDAVDTNDNGKIEVDEMADFQKSLDDYASKNKKGRDDIPVTTRR